MGDGRGVGSCLYFEYAVLFALEYGDELGVVLVKLNDGLERLLEEVMPSPIEVNIEVVPTELKDDGVDGGKVELDNLDAELLSERGLEKLDVGVVVVVVIGVDVCRALGV